MQDFDGSVQDCKLNFYLKVLGQLKDGYRSRITMVLQIQAGIHIVIACLGAIWLVRSYEHGYRVPDPRNQLSLRMTPNHNYSHNIPWVLR